MFDGFELERVDVGEAELRVRHGGSGPPLVLLHGHPRTHTTWHGVAAMGRTIGCPVLVAWSRHDDTDRSGDPVEIWRAWAADVRGAVVDSGHHMAEDAPEQLAATLRDFFA